jgi:hypothetical protein
VFSAFCAAENPQKIDLHQCYRLIVRAACAHGRLMRQHLVQPKREQAASYRQTCPGYFVFVFGIIHKQDQHEHAIAEQYKPPSSPIPTPRLFFSCYPILPLFATSVTMTNNFDF